MRALLIVAAFASGCFEDRYRCTTDAQCNLGEGGRCEKDEYCTKFDASCNSGRRYQHAGEHGDACFDDSAVLRNACAGGQQPAKSEGCFANVCERVPACCEMAWTDSCVQLAQELCTSFTCDTRIAITAIRGATNELWDLRWDGSAWSIDLRDELRQPLQWVAPEPGGDQPRLAATTLDGALVVGELGFAAEPNRTYSSITTINFDRDRRDTIVVGHTGLGGGDPRVEILKPQPGADTQRATSATSATSLVWGDLDRDSFPDAVARTVNLAQYHFLPSRDSDNHVRDLRTGTLVNPAGGLTEGSPQVRNVDWIDVDGDKHLDLVVFGNDLRVHTDKRQIVEMPELRVDCDPPSTLLSCVSAPEPNLEAISFGGAAMPTKTANELVLSTYPGRKLYRASFAGGAFALERILFPNDACGCTADCPPPCPAQGCMCTYTCTACLPIVAVVVRDLDGDHALDIVAIDSKLTVYHAFAKMNFREWIETKIITTTLGNPEGFISISTSVSGATL